MGNVLELCCYEEISEYDTPDNIFTIPENKITHVDKSTMTDCAPCNDISIRDKWFA